MDIFGPLIRDSFIWIVDGIVGIESKALFSSKIFYKIGIVALSFVFCIW